MKYVACVAALVVGAGAASAAWSIVSRTSKVYALGDNAPVGQISSTALTPFNESRSSQGSYGSAAGSQMSSLSLNGASIESTGSGHSSRKPGGSGSYGTFNAQSQFTVVFNVASTMNYQLQGSRSGFPNSTTIFLKNLATNQFVFFHNSSDPDAFNYIGNIGLGSYQLEVSVNLGGGAGFDGVTTLDATWSVVPAPSACAMLGLAGLTAIRRRR